MLSQHFIINPSCTKVFGAHTFFQRNQSAFEPFSEAVDEAIQFVSSNLQYSVYGEQFDSFNEQENSGDQMEFVNSSQGQTSQDENLATDDIFIPERNSSVFICIHLYAC